MHNEKRRNTKRYLSDASRNSQWIEQWTYAPVQWSNQLRKGAQQYADHLVSKTGPCRVGIHNNANNWNGDERWNFKQFGYSESITGGAKSWLSPVDNIGKFFVDNEKHPDRGSPSMVYPKNQHLSNVLWQENRYIGCADALKNGCNAQVCWYDTGNAGLGRLGTAEKREKWMLGQGL